MLRHTVCKRERKRMRERDMEQGERHCGSMSVRSRYSIVCLQSLCHLFVQLCISQIQQVILLLQANENSVRGRSDCGRREGDRESKRETETGRARFLD